MPVRLRLAMHGQKHKKVFHLVAINNTERRNAQPKELLGIYDPHDRDLNGTRMVRWSVERIRYWLSVGAQPSDRVVKMLERGGILAPGSKYASKATVPKHPTVEIPPPGSKTPVADAIAKQKAKKQSKTKPADKSTPPPANKSNPAKSNPKSPAKLAS